MTPYHHDLGALDASDGLRRPNSPSLDSTIIDERQSSRVVNIIESTLGWQLSVAGDESGDGEYVVCRNNTSIKGDSQSVLGSLVRIRTIKFNDDAGWGIGWCRPPCAGNGDDGLRWANNPSMGWSLHESRSVVDSIESALCLHVHGIRRDAGDGERVVGIDS